MNFFFIMDCFLILNKIVQNFLSLTFSMETPQHSQAFGDCFRALIHYIDKLSYRFSNLLSFLKGGTYSLMKSTPVTSQSYIVAYSLRNKYLDHVLIARIYWHNLGNAKVVSSKSIAGALRTVVSTFNENDEISESIAKSVAQWDFIFLKPALALESVNINTNWIISRNYGNVHSKNSRICQNDHSLTISYLLIQNLKLNDTP